MESHYLHQFESFKIIQIPILKDNYAYILTNEKCTAVIDPGDATPIISKCKELNLWPTHILNTHHHWDHTNGNLGIKEEFGCEVWGPLSEADRIPGLSKGLTEGPIILGGLNGQVLSAPGHTKAHILLYFKLDQILFTGDVLFCGGCGRLFEGSANEMYISLQKIKALPAQTRIFCGHEYSLKNLEFAKSVGIKNLETTEIAWTRQREKNIPTVPSTLELELKINPFLLARSVEEFTQLRLLKDNF